MRVFLLTSHPVAPPWDSGDKNMARTLLLSDAGVEYVFVGDRADPSPWPPQHQRMARRYRSDQPTGREKARLLSWLLLHPPECDVVHSVVSFQPHKATQGVLSALPLIRNRPLVVTCPTSSLPMGLLRRAQAAVALTHRTAQVLRDAGIGPVHRIPPGVDLARFEPAPTEDGAAMLGIEPGRYLLFAGHHDPGGGLDGALVVTSRLRARGVEASLLLALRNRPGEDAGARRKELHARITELGLDGCVVELGARANMRAAILASSVLLFQPARLGMKMELPLTLLEGLACGRPVVVSDEAGLVELADSSAAVWVGSPDDASLMDHLERLFLDAGHAAECAYAARRLASTRYSAEAMVGAYAELYRSLTN